MTVRRNPLAGQGTEPQVCSHSLGVAQQCSPAKKSSIRPQAHSSLGSRDSWMNTQVPMGC